MKWKYSFWMTSGPVAGVVRNAGKVDTFRVWRDPFTERRASHISQG